MSSYRETSRDRVLTDDELAAVILAARGTSRPYGPIVEFLALTGQRPEEVAQLRWNEIDEKTRTWSIPGSRTKNKKAHIVHLSEQAWMVLETPRGASLYLQHRGGSTFRVLERAKRSSMNYRASADGGITTSVVPLSLEWPD